MLRTALATLTALAAMTSVASAAPGARGDDVRAAADGLYRNVDARAVCSDLAATSRWTGQWTTTQWGEMSVCGCTVGRDTRSSFDVEAGPIWSNQHAQSVCPAVCDAARWTGAYTRDTARSQSTCTLDYPGRIASAVRVAFAPRAVVAPRRPVTRHAYRPVRAHRRY